jgi:hypothetical protein
MPLEGAVRCLCLYGVLWMIPRFVLIRFNLIQVWLTLFPFPLVPLVAWQHRWIGNDVPPGTVLPI